jgi:cytochrome P450
VVRIQPHEVHLIDQEHFETTYHVGSKYIKCAAFYDAFMAPNSTFGSISNESHKQKRSRLNHLFSRKMVLQLEDIMQKAARQVVSLTKTSIAAQQPMDLHHALRCVSVDVITEYAFDRSFDLLHTPDLAVQFFANLRGLAPGPHIFRQLPLPRRLVMSIPPRIAMHMGEPVRQMIRMQQDGIDHLIEVKERMDAGQMNADRPTIFSELLEPQKRVERLTVDELKDEVFSVVSAAIDNTGNVMTVACYKVIGNPSVYSRARTELLEAFPDTDATLPLVVLEKLPYLVCR